MKGFVKWFLVPVVLLAGLALARPQRADAARWRTHVYYPGYHVHYVAPYRYRCYYPVPPAPVYWAPPPLPVRVYYPPVVVPPRVVVPHPPFWY